jgi:hypothetical protein
MRRLERECDDSSEKGKSVPVVRVGHHAHLTLDGSNLLLRSWLRATHSEERHVGQCVSMRFEISDGFKTCL